ncbi:MAG: TonB-dependent receptor [Woeseiaceae bacterium]|nr:TonB-dependent receptor [Woeseiaceae bacterium]
MSLAVAAALPGAIALPQVAVAQDDGEVIEEIIATGYRSSLRNAMMMKQSNESIVEAVTAEDIGKLPDASIAESLARLPGLTAQRLNGRGQQISIRGLGPDFTTALLNGREQVTTGDNRGVEFDQYPAELLSGVVVYKTPTADLVGQGLSGTADLQTIRPLQTSGRILAGNVRYEWNDLSAVPGSSSDGIRASFTYADKFADDRVGLALGLAHMTNPNQEERFEAWGYADADGDSVIGGSKPFLRSGELERTGVIGTLEFMPSDRLTTSLDVFYSEFTEDQQLKGIEVPLQWGGAGETLSNSTVSDGLVTSGTFSDTYFVGRNDILLREADLLSAGWNIEFDLTENWMFEFDASTSQVDRKDTDRESYSGLGYNYSGPRSTTDFSMTGSGAVFASDADFSDPGQLVLTDPRGWGGGNIQAGYQKIFNITDELSQFRAEVSREFGGPISNMVIGANFATREKDKRTDEGFLNFGGPTEAPLPSTTGVANLNFVGLGGLVTYDPLSVDYTLQRNFNGDITLKNWNVEEDVLLGYIKFGIDTEWGDVGVFGNFGVQIMDVDQSSTALATDGGGVTGARRTDGDTWNEVLPSVNLNFAFANDNFLRFSVARTVARARMDQMRAAFSYNFNNDNRNETDILNSPWSASGGNPRVQPWVADGIDLSYEKYFADAAGYVSLAVFYKDLKEFIIEQDLPFDFTGFPAPPPAPGQDPTIGTNLGFINAPINGKGGDIQGVELAVQFSGDIIADAIRDFGIVANYSHTTSSVKADGMNEISIPGLSEDVANITLYYENENFQARVSNRYRSDFLGEVSGFGGDRNFRTIKSESVLDAQIGWLFTGRLEGWSVQLQGFNLTDEPLGSFDNDDTRFVRDNQRYGRSYMFGVSYRAN